MKFFMKLYADNDKHIRRRTLENDKLEEAINGWLAREVIAIFGKWEEEAINWFINEELRKTLEIPQPLWQTVDGIDWYITDRANEDVLLGYFLKRETTNQTIKPQRKWKFHENEDAYKIIKDAKKIYYSAFG
jgi:hypothetical protein